MQYRDVTCHHALKRITRQDVLFHGQYTVDPYQRCTLGCRYCDSAQDSVDVQVNIADVLDHELKTVPKGRVILGSVHDPYQPVEEQTGLSHKVLLALREHGFSCQILTKSPLVLRDVDVLASFDCHVTISLLSVDSHLADVFEPKVASPRARLDLVRTIRRKNVTAGVALIPFLPVLAESSLESTIAAVADAQASYLVYKHLELKGEQRDLFLEVLARDFPEAVHEYHMWYDEAIAPDSKYLKELREKIQGLCQRYALPCRSLLP